MIVCLKKGVSICSSDFRCILITFKTSKDISFLFFYLSGALFRIVPNKALNFSILHQRETVTAATTTVGFNYSVIFFAQPAVRRGIWKVSILALPQD